MVQSVEPRLRERKRIRTRTHIAATAARLFAERGFEHTSVTEVARAAEVSEQTVYNYFPNKKSLVLDRDDEVRDRFVAAVRDRAPGTGPAAAVRDEALALAEHVRTLAPDELRGTLGVLVATSPAVRRLSLEATDRLADALVPVLAATGGPAASPAWAKTQALALAWLSQTVVDESGRLILEGLGAAEVADRTAAVVAELVDELDRTWFR